MAEHSHDHSSHSHGVSADADRSKLAIALGLIVGFMLVEVVVGVNTHSLSAGPDLSHGVRNVVRHVV